VGEGPVSGTATIVFTDLVGSTQLRGRLGDRVADELRRAHDQMLGAAIVEHGGTVVKGLGDGVLAAFGGAAAGVEAAVAIQRSVERANRRVDDARRLAVRIGLSAGDVSWEEGDCHGTPVVAAARLCDRAEGGQILCDELVRGLARGRTELSFRSVGELTLKGLADPVLAFEVPWESVTGEQAPLPAPLVPLPRDLPFAGRDRERDALAAAWKSAQTDGRMVELVSGEPGVGKTRLCAEVARTAHLEGAWVLCGRCDENISAPFAPWIEMLRHVVAHASDDVLAGHIERHGGELTRLVPEIAHRVPSVPAPRVLDPETERLALFDGVVDLLDALAADAPALLVVDDAHWADAASLMLLRHVARCLPREAAVLVLVTYRDTDVDRSHPLAAMIGQLRREPQVEQLSLRGIDEAGMRALLTAAGGHELEDDGIEFAHTLAVETEGNPFFVGEIIRHLVETGVLVQVEGRWRGSVPISEAGIPEGVRDVVGRRLSLLTDEANETLRTAAVVGREFSVDVVARVMDRGYDGVLVDLETAIAASLVSEVAGAPGRMVFSHALVQSTLAEELSTTRRVRLHRAIGETLEQIRGCSEAELAHHFSEAAATGVADRAIQHARLAAEEAHARLAYDEVVHFYDLALEALDASDADDHLRAELLIERGYAQHERGDQDAGRSDALAAATAARKTGDAALVGRSGIAYLGLVGHWAAPADPVAADLMREGLDGLAAEDRVTRARVVATLAIALVLVPGDEALSASREAERLALECADDDALYRALAGGAWALRSRGCASDLCRTARRAVEVSERAARRDWEFTSRYLLGVGLIESGDLDGAAAELEAAGRIPSVLSGWAPAVFAVSRSIAEGQLNDLETGIEEAAELGAALGDTNEAIRCGQHAVLAAVQGDFDKALAWADRQAQTLLGAAIGTRMLILAEAGDLSGAADAHRAWHRDVRQLVPQLLQAWTLSNEAAVAFRGADPELADGLGTELEPFRGSFLGADTQLIGPAEYVIARVAYTQHRFDDAVAFSEQAVDVADRLGLHQLATQHRIDAARARLARNHAGDSERAQALLIIAHDAATAMGLRPAQREALALRA
jgi:class 3 adenylate cyclase